MYPQYRGIERSPIAQRFAPAGHEYRACGRFTGREVAELLGGARDMRDLGCPEHICLRVLESRARRAGNPAPAAPLHYQEPNYDLKNRMAATNVQIRRQEAEIAALPSAGMTDEDFRADAARRAESKNLENARNGSLMYPWLKK